MKRLWVCLALLLCAVSVCVCARVGLRRVTVGETALLERAGQAVAAGETDEIESVLQACERYWKEERLPFYLFIDHNFFNQFEYTLFHLRDYANRDAGLALERIGYCTAVLEDLADSQRPVLENIF